MTPSKTIVFIHGLFMNPKSWLPWIYYFESKSYQCHAPAFPFHEGEPSELRAHNPLKLGELTFEEVIDSLQEFVSILHEKPILIGHSIGGLAVQKLMDLDLGSAGICIHSAPLPGMITHKPSFWKSNLPVLNFFKGNSVFNPSKEWFQYAFCNTMSKAESDKAYDNFVVPESRNIPRSTLKGYPKIDINKAHNPLLFIGGEKDNIVPVDLNIANHKAYKDTYSTTDIKIFNGRGHFTCGETGWEELAEFILSWIEKR